jgi:hypothetical protein
MSKNDDRDDSDPGRDALHDAIQGLSPDDILTGWVVAAEWMDKDGKRMLGVARAAETTPWNAKGMIISILDSETVWDVL